MTLTPSRQLPWWKKLFSLLLQVVVFVLIAMAAGLLLGLLAELLLPSQWFSSELPALLVDWSIILLSVLLAVRILDYAQARLGWTALGFAKENIITSLQLGFTVGSGIILLCFLVLYLGGWVSIVKLNFIILPFLGWLLFFLIQPLAEEIIMRAFLQNQIHRYFGAWPGLVASALVFGLLHAGNNAFTWIAGVEIVLGGLLMGQLYLYCQNIWAPFALHAVWNFLQSTVLGFAVSGMDTYRVFDLKISGPEWLTGGDFGLEGSILSVLLLLFAVIYFWSAALREAPWSKMELLLKENHQQTAHESDSV